MSKLEALKLCYLQNLGKGVRLSTFPIYSCGTFFQNPIIDELRDRCYLPLVKSTSHCDSYNAKFSTVQCLSCKVGGLIFQRDDESRDIIIFLASAIFLPSVVRYELLIHSCRDSDPETSASNMYDIQTGLATELNSDRGDILIRGF